MYENLTSRLCECSSGRGGGRESRGAGVRLDLHLRAHSNVLSLLHVRICPNNVRYTPVFFHSSSCREGRASAPLSSGGGLDWVGRLLVAPPTTRWTTTRTTSCTSAGGASVATCASRATSAVRTTAGAICGCASSRRSSAGPRRRRRPFWRISSTYAAEFGFCK